MSGHTYESTNKISEMGVHNCETNMYSMVIRVFNFDILPLALLVSHGMPIMGIHIQFQCFGFFVNTRLLRFWLLAVVM